MNKITLNETGQLNIQNPDCQLQVCDESGRTVGYYLPARWGDELLYSWAKARVSDDERELARQQTGGRSLAEILADLESKCGTQ